MSNIAAILLIVATVIIVFVGVRLLLVARSTRGLPELLIGLAFTFDGIGLGVGQLGQRLLWAGSDSLAPWLNGMFFGVVAAGMFAFYAGVWLIFGRKRVECAATCLLGCTLIAIAYGMRIGSGDFVTVTLFPDNGHPGYAAQASLA